MALRPQRPEAGERIDVVVAWSGERLTSVVDGIEESSALLLRAPVDEEGAPVDVLPDGTHLTVSWLSPTGRHELDVVLTEVLHDRMALWLVEAVDAARTTQLRRFARAQDALPARVARGNESWRAVVADLGEGGARCVVVQTRAIQEGDAVVLHMNVEATDLGLPASVLEVTALPEARSQLRLGFADIGRDADVVRRRVLEQQRRSRATA